MRRERLPAVDSPALEAFAAVAAEFCSLVESHRSLGRDEFLRGMHLALPRLYLAGVQLPSTAILFTDAESASDAGAGGELPAESEPDPDRLSNEDAAALCFSLGELIGERGLYRKIFDPYEPSTQPEVMGMPADDFADIFRDVQDGLTKWRRGESGEALWEWRFGLENHWGKHLVEALHALYVLTASYEFIWPLESASDRSVP
jgi:hypothetical protein